MSEILDTEYWRYWIYWRYWRYSIYSRYWWYWILDTEYWIPDNG